MSLEMCNSFAEAQDGVGKLREVDHDHPLAGYGQGDENDILPLTTGRVKANTPGQGCAGAWPKTSAIHLRGHTSSSR